MKWKNNRINIIMLVLVILLTVSLYTFKLEIKNMCVKQNKLEIKYAKITRANNSFLIKTNDTMYYSNFSLGKEQLYKKSINNDKCEKINDDIPRYLNIYNEWLIYSNANDNYKIYSYNISTGTRNKINNINSRYNTIFNNEIYYLNYEDNKIYKTTVDKKHQIRVVNELADEFCIYKNNIYYINVADNKKLYKISLDGKEKTKITDYEIKFLNICNDNIYCINVTDNYSIYKVDIDGQESKKINNNKCWNLVLDNNFLYYSNYSDFNNLGRLYSINLKNEYECKKLVDEEFISINVVDDWIYYTNDIYTAKDGDLYLKRYNINSFKIEYIK